MKPRKAPKPIFGHTAMMQRLVTTNPKVVADAMRMAGMPKEQVYAFEKTGVLVTAQSRFTLPIDAVQQWDAALKEYREMDHV